MAKIKLEAGVKYALKGKIVTMNAQSEVIDKGILYIQDDTIMAVQPADQPAPDGWYKSKAINVSGTMFPGMIELHNHLAYNIIPMWDVPKTFQNRDRWRTHSEYRQKMTGPLEILGHIDGYLQAIVRYTECKLLFSGVTSSQGITLASHGGIRSLYKGMIRNVEQTLDQDLPSALTKIADVKKASALLRRLKLKKTYLLHLAEGTQESANKHFRALQFPNSNEWAITEHLAGIHAVGLLPADIKIMADHGGKIIWSPMSNLLLYGVTADIESIKENNILLSIGSDWSPSGSKNLLNEIKVAKLFSDAKGGVFTNEELVRMVTTNPARTLQWQDKCGSLEVGKKADLFVIKGVKDDVYDQFIECREKYINWVIVDGIPRFGIRRLMNKFEGRKELIEINRWKRSVYLEIKDQDNPIDLDVNYKKAKKLLKSGLKKLRQLAVQVEAADDGLALGASGSGAGGFSNQLNWVIDADHADHGDVCGRHHIPLDGVSTTIETDDLNEGATPLSEIVGPVLLDESNVEEDRFYFKKLALQKNLPEYLKLELPLYYDQTISLTEAQDYKLEILTKERDNFDHIQSIKSFLSTPGYLTLNEKVLILEQAETVVKEAYVHLIQKNALYASNPIDQLRVIKNELLNSENTIPEVEFHRKVIQVFNGLRDLHTLYQLPEPFASKVAFLPFFIEKYFEKGEDKYTVSKIIGQPVSKTFIKGIQITHWNGIPIKRAILINGRNYAGSNEEARVARGLDSLTFRPLSVMLPPEEEWINITYKSAKGRVYNQRFSWHVGSLNTLRWKNKDKDDQTGALGLSSGYDYLSEVVQGMKKDFFATSVPAVKKSMRDKGMRRPGMDYMLTTLDKHFKAKLIPNKKNKIGYVRIYSFKHSNPHEFAKEFVRIIESFKTDKLILDIRNNPGGSIWAAEFILQSLSKKIIKPQPAQFLNSPLAHYICQQHSPSSIYPSLNLNKWYDTLKTIRTTGAKYSVAYPITPVDEIRKYRAKKNYEAILITDALCYSASDIFASGFRDHKIGKILGIDENTGAGGANVWTLSQLYNLTKNSYDKSEYFVPLPYGADIRVAIRRTIRTGPSRGLPLEDLGVEPDHIHLMTKNDLLHKNEDLIKTAISLLVPHN